MERKNKGEALHPKTLIGVLFGFRPSDRLTPETGLKIVRARVCRKFEPPRLLLDVREPSDYVVELDFRYLIAMEKEGRILWQNRDPQLKLIQIPEPPPTETS